MIYEDCCGSKLILRVILVLYMRIIIPQVNCCKYTKEKSYGK